MLSADIDALPARVRRELQAEQDLSERWVAVAQIAVIAFMAVLYLVAPTGYAPNPRVKAVPLGLAFITALVVLRYWFYRSGQLTPRILVASGVAEMTVLMTTVVAYGIQYEIPLSLALRNTVFVYAFVLIALRALRFDPATVVVSGAMAVAGWVILTLVAWYHAGAHGMTWDYVTYAMTGRMHLGAELDKILALAIFTAVLATILARARRTLRRAVSEERAATDLARFFERDVVESIRQARDAPAVGSGVVRNAAIVFIDLRGFTKASEGLPPAQIIALLGEYQELVVPIVHAHRGSIDKFMGDGILASFGATTPSDRFAADAFAAIDAILAATGSWRAERRQRGLVELRVGAGLAVGPVVFGAIGNSERLEFTVIGEAVNLAAKLEKHNKKESSAALAALDALELAASQGYLSQREIRRERRVDGLAQPISLAVWPLD